MKNLIIAALFLVSSAWATTFDDVAKTFTDSIAAEHKAVTGYWSGRCVADSEPNELRAAILVHKLVKDDSSFPPTRPSLSYFYDTGKNPKLFDKMTPAQIENQPTIKKWFAREQWQEAKVVDGSLVNYFDASADVKIERALRLYEGEFDQLLVLRITRIAKSEKAVSHYCYFDNKLGGATEPLPSDVDFPEVGPVANQWISVINSNPGKLYRNLEIINTGDRTVTLQNIEWYNPTGTKLVDPRPLTLAPGQAMRWHQIGAAAFQVARVNFYVAGSTSRLQVRGIVY